MPNPNSMADQIDDFDRILVSNVHPQRWENPKPAGRYNLAVIGAGTAGLVAAAGAAALGGRVALIEKHLLGGDCLNMGCVPSKAIIRSARAALEARTCSRFGIDRCDAEADFGAVMARMRRLRSQISFHDSALRFTDLGVDVFLGKALFSGTDSIQVGETRILFGKALIATGARAAVPQVEGLMEAGFFTNETIFSLTERPPRLAIIGGGPLGCELAQAFHRLGSRVSLFQRSDRLLDREDEDASRLLQDVFIREGIQVLLGSRLKRVSVAEEGKIVVYEQSGRESSIIADAVLAGVGRAPNVEGFGLEAAGVAYDLRRGVLVNDRLQTTNPNIYAAGDVCLPFKFTHTADASARIALQNALFLGRKKLSSLVIPWVTYTDPEIAHVGMYENEAERKQIKTITFTEPLANVDRAVLDGETTGFLKILVRRGSDKILGATIVAKHAGEMVNEISLAMAAGLGMKAIFGVVHPYPTQAEVIRRAADAYNRGRLTPIVKRLLSSWLYLGRSALFPAASKCIGGIRRILNHIAGTNQR